MMIHTLFELEPIGISGRLEAVCAWGFCSLECSDRFMAAHPDTTLSPAYEPDTFEDGHCCDHCGKPMEDAAELAGNIVARQIQDGRAILGADGEVIDPEVKP